MSDLIERLYESDQASALTNEAARRIQRLESYMRDVNSIIQGRIDSGIPVHKSDLEYWTKLMEFAYTDKSK